MGASTSSAACEYRDPNDAARAPDRDHAGAPGRTVASGAARRLADVGPQTVTELRHFALTHTIYRSSDATRVMSTLLHAGALTTDAPHNRLSGDAIVRATVPRRNRTPAPLIAETTVASADSEPGQNH